MTEGTTMVRSRRLLLASVAAAAMLAGAVPARAACELKLGIVGGLSGATAQWGLALKAAVEFVAADTNQAGGLKVGSETCQVTTAAVDSKASAEGAAAAANQLVSQGVKFIVGPVVSPEATGIKPIAARNNLLVFLDSYAKNSLSPQYPLVFHEGPGPSVWADPIIKAAKAQFHIKSVVVVAPNDQGGTDIASVDVDIYKKNDIDATDEYYQRGTQNFAAIVTRILSRHPDAVDTSSSAPSDAGVIVKQLREAGFKGPIGRLGGAATDEILRIVGGPEVLRDFYWFENVPTADPKVKTIYADFKKVMGVDAPENTNMILWSAATRMLLQAISNAGTITDTKKVAEALRELPVHDKYLGDGHWTGKAFFGINQEISFPFGIGMMVDGKLLPVERVEAPDAG
jgi:branched-chain amino acid transport system substrate-binding protein